MAATAIARPIHEPRIYGTHKSVSYFCRFRVKGHIDTKNVENNEIETATYEVFGRDLYPDSEYPNSMHAGDIHDKPCMIVFLDLRTGQYRADQIDPTMPANNVFAVSNLFTREYLRSDAIDLAAEYPTEYAPYHDGVNVSKRGLLIGYSDFDFDLS